jgi:cell division protein FtsL
MDEQSPTSQDKQKSETAASPVKKPEAINPATTEPATAQQLADVEKEMTGFERATLGWAKVAVLMSGLAAIFVCAQWYEMHVGGQDTHALAEAAKKQSDKMSNMSDAADKIRQAAQDMVVQDQRIADNAQRAMDASNKQSQASIQATRDAMRLDQRAWVSAEPATGVPTNEGSYTIQFPIKNTGKTPATNVAVYFMGRFFKPDEKLTYKFTGLPLPSGYLSPNSPRAFAYSGEPGTVDVAAHKGEIFVVYGAITYEDVFSVKHWITYCFDAPKADKYTYCYEHNDIGDGPLPKDSLQFQAASGPN